MSSVTKTKQNRVDIKCMDWDKTDLIKKKSITDKQRWIKFIVMKELSKKEKKNNSMFCNITAFDYVPDFWKGNALIASRMGTNSRRKHNLLVHRDMRRSSSR